MRGLTSVFGALLLVVLGSSQGTIDISYPPTISTGGVLTTIDFGGVGGANQQTPNIASYTTSVSAPGTGYLVIWEIKKTHGYNRISGALYVLGTPLGVATLSHGWAPGTRYLEFQPPFWSWFGTRPNDEEKYGKFELVLQYRPSSGSYTTVSIMTWTIRPQDYNSGSGGGGGGNNNGDNSGGTGDQGGFWSSLFVPSEASLDMLSEAVENLFGWGPFGILTGRAVPAPSGYEGAYFSDDLKLDLNIAEGGPGGIGYGAAGTYQLDLEPYADVVTFLRYLILAVLYFVFLSRMWSSVSRLLGLSGGVIGSMGHFTDNAGPNIGGGDRESVAKLGADLDKMTGKYR